MVGIDVGGAGDILIGSPEGEAEGLLTAASSAAASGSSSITTKPFCPVQDPPRPQAAGSKNLECCPLQAAATRVAVWY